MRAFESLEGVRWGVEVSVPGSSNAMIVFHHPSADTGRFDRYAWYNATTPEAKSVTSRLNPKTVLGSLSDQDLARLFRRSMPVSAADTPLVEPVRA